MAIDTTDETAATGPGGGRLPRDGQTIGGRPRGTLRGEIGMPIALLARFEGRRPWVLGGAIFGYAALLVFSDRLGRRKPFVLIAAPAAVAAFGYPGLFLTGAFVGLLGAVSVFRIRGSR